MGPGRWVKKPTVTDLKRKSCFLRVKNPFPCAAPQHAVQSDTGTPIAKEKNNGDLLHILSRFPENTQIALSFLSFATTPS